MTSDQNLLTTKSQIILRTITFLQIMSTSKNFCVDRIKNCSKYLECPPQLIDYAWWLPDYLQRRLHKISTSVNHRACLHKVISIVACQHEASTLRYHQALGYFPSIAFFTDTHSTTATPIEEPRDHVDLLVHCGQPVPKKEEETTAAKTPLESKGGSGANYHDDDN